MIEGVLKPELSVNVSLRTRLLTVSNCYSTSTCLVAINRYSL